GVKVPAGTDSGSSLRVKDKGMPGKDSPKKGDLYVHLRIRTPEKLSQEEKELYQQLKTLNEKEKKNAR
ncbi:MAG: DnaJ C-terminal domain-containing protein, partial [Flavobacteriales bacterium]